MKAKVIIADPPWSYRQHSSKLKGTAQAHYETMGDEDIAAIPVADFAAPDCVLLMWGTWPKLPQGLEVLTSWGFEFVTGLPWVKTLPTQRDLATGIGFWFQSASEFVLIGRRGAPKRKPTAAPSLGLLCGSQDQLYAPRSKHSRKPETLHYWAEARFDGPYLELFARRERPGWECWGNELGYNLDRHGVSKCEPVRKDSEQGMLFS